MQAKKPAKVILCHFLPCMYLIIVKIYRNVKLLLIPVPPSGGGVWCDTPDPNVRTTVSRRCAWI